MIRDDPVAAVSELQQQDGRDLIMYGHGRLSHPLLEHHLLDESDLRFTHYYSPGERPVMATGRCPAEAHRRDPTAERGRRPLLPARPQLKPDQPEDPCLARPHTGAATGPPGRSRPLHDSLRKWMNGP